MGNTSEFMEHLAIADAEGRIMPGAGPLYTRRVLPAVLPVRRRELVDAELTRSRINRLYTQLTRGIMLPRASPATRPDDPPVHGTDAVFPFGRGDDPGDFGHDIVSRARAHLMLNPRCVLGGWGALGAHGVPHWADSAGVLLHSPHRSAAGSSHSADAVRNTGAPVFQLMPKDLVPCHPDPAFPEMSVVPVGVAVGQVLAAVIGRRHRWFTSGVNGISLDEVRAVQIIDSVRQATELSAEQIVDACRYRLDRHRAEHRVGLSDDGAQSPQETMLRLITAGELPDGLQWTSQVPVDLGAGASGTVLDLACEDLKLALYYDGGHHRDPAQATRDFEQFQQLRDLGWEVIRVDKQLLYQRRGKLLEQIRNAVERARQRS